MNHQIDSGTLYNIESLINLAEKIISGKEETGDRDGFFRYIQGTREGINRDKYRGIHVMFSTEDINDLIKRTIKWDYELELLENNTKLRIIMTDSTGGIHTRIHPIIPPDIAHRIIDPCPESDY
jgi:hypothetical protein